MGNHKFTAPLLFSVFFFSFFFSMSGCTKKSESPSAGPGTSTSAISNAAPTGDEILVGEVGSLTGSEATFGTSTRDGIDLAVEQINANGGIKGKKLRVLVMVGSPGTELEFAL